MTVLERHALSAAFGNIPADEFAELVKDIKRNGLLQPIVTIAEGDKHWVLDGWHRYLACIEAGVKLRTEGFAFVIEPAAEQAGRSMTPVEFVVASNAHRRHLTPGQRRSLLIELLKAKPDASDRAIASMANVDHKTVAQVRQRAEVGGEIPHQPDRVGRDGKRQSAVKKTAATAAPEIACADPLRSASSGRKLQALDFDLPKLQGTWKRTQDLLQRHLKRGWNAGVSQTQVTRVRKQVQALLTELDAIELKFHRPLAEPAEPAEPAEGAEPQNGEALA